VDALRADHMALYGYGRDTTPNLSRLVAAGQARVAPAVRTACSESFCGLLSLASSRFVHQFSTRMFTLQQVFQQHGYRTIMVMGGDHTHFYGLREQYGKVDIYLDASTSGKTYMNDDRFVLDRLAELPRWDGRPVMIQTHLMSAHMLGKRFDESTVFQPWANYYFPMSRLEAGRPSPRAVNFYDNGVLQSDRVIAAMLERLKARGYLEDALVAVTGDHGEGLGEHGIWAHHVGIYDEVVRVPLVLIDFGHPAGRALRANPWPSQVDTAPTLLEELGIPRPRTWVGRPLQQPPVDDFAYLEQDPIAGLLDRRDPSHLWKYGQDRLSGEAFAYDLSTDPGETRNAIASVSPALLHEWQLRMLPIKAQSASGAAFSR
jgi:arylsulfatase A-like enzyme